MYHSELISESQRQATRQEKKKPKMKLNQLFMGLRAISIKKKRPKNRKKP
jgi:hypothetical protein